VYVRLFIKESQPCKQWYFLFFFLFYALPHLLSLFRGGGLSTSKTRIDMLAGVYTPGRAFQARQLEG